MKIIHKDKLKKGALAFGSLLFLTSFLPSPVQAEQIVENREMPITAKDEIAFEAKANKLANPEPKASIEKRENEQRRIEEKARKEAEEKSEQMTKERAEKWEKAFPIIQGNEKEAQFINSIAKDAVELSNNSKLYVSVMIAQASLESNYGRSGLASKYHNFFGVKGAYQGKTAKMSTKEDMGSGNMIRIKSGFRVYPSARESLADYSNLIRNGIESDPNFYSNVWKENAKTYAEATKSLQGRYATDTRYAAKLNHIIEHFNLTEFDNVQPLPTEPVIVEPEIPNPPAIPDGQYTAKSVDSFRSIARKFDLTDDQLMALNELSEPSIYINQVLIVKKTPEMELKEKAQANISNPKELAATMVDSKNGTLFEVKF